MDDARSLLVVSVPTSTIVDGAVVELAVAADGCVSADVRIPGPAVP